MCLPEGRVDIGQVSVTLQHGGTEQGEGLLGERPGLATFGVDVGVRTEERHPHSELVPTHSEFLRGVFEESRDIGTGEGDTGHSERE